MADIINPDLARFKAVRARGPGGQRVNRRSTKIQAWAKIEDLSLSDFQKQLIRKKLANHINGRDELEVEEEEESSQFLNKKRALGRPFLEVLMIKIFFLYFNFAQCKQN